MDEPAIPRSLVAATHIVASPQRMKLSRRKFIASAVRCGAAAGGGASWLRLAPPLFAATAAKPLKLCMLSGSEEYKSNESLAAFQDWVEKQQPIECSRAFWKSKTELPGLDALAGCDVMLLFTKRLEIPNDQLELVKKYCLAGRPVVGLRTASHAFQQWLELDRTILGGDYHGHYKAGDVTKVEIAGAAAKHAVLKGVEPFESPSKLYKNPSIAADTTLLLTGTIPEHKEPVAWTRKNGDGRVFYTSLGGPDDFQNKNFQTLLVNAIFWAAEREAVH